MNRAVVLSIVVAGLSFAQAPQDDQNYPQLQPAPAGQRLSAEDLSNLVAPIALYPDMLLSQVLAASTYPAEITQARDWMQQNPGLRGRQLVDAAKQQNWDPSVQALVAFPDVMNLLTRDIQWTTDLGNAFLSQQADVMDAIQRLRASARANGRLTNTPQQRVTYEQQNGENAIVIQPTDPQTIYPPVYNPVYVWGPPAYGYYPPLGYPGPGYGVGFGFGTFLGGLFAGLFSFGGWGWGLSWLSHGLFLNGLFFNHFGFHGYSGPGYAHVAWAHNPVHRLGVPYSGHYAAAHFAGGHAGAGGGHAYNAGHSTNGFAGAGRPAASNRQADAYRGLAAGAARSGGYSSQHYSSRATQGGVDRGERASSGHGWSGASSQNRASQPRASQDRASQDRASQYHAAARNSGGRSSSPHYSAPKASGHSGGGHSGGGHSHSSSGGHSHGGSHKK